MTGFRAWEKTVISAPGAKERVAVLEAELRSAAELPLARQNRRAKRPNGDDCGQDS